MPCAGAECSNFFLFLFGTSMVTTCTVFVMPLYLGVFNIFYIYLHITFCLIYLVYSYVVTTITTSVIIYGLFFGLERVSLVNTFAVDNSSHVNILYPTYINPYPTAFPYGNGMVLHFYQQQESSTTKTVHKVINKGLKIYV